MKLLLAACSALAGCSHPAGYRAVTAEPLNRPLLRFDRDLFGPAGDFGTADVERLRGKYGLFFDLFCSRVLRIRDTSDSATANYLFHFVNDPDLRMLKAMSDSLYGDGGYIKDGLNRAFGYYRHYFPERNVPRFVTCLSAFNYRVITADSVLAVSLDMYLGARHADMYESVGFPAYLSARFGKPYLVADCMKGWFQSEYEADSVKGDLISHMVYYGKMLYFLDCMMPDTPDTVKIGYTAAQLGWCERNEANIWAHFIEQELLFNTNEQIYFKYINEGPTTGGLPRESPARLGRWIGWRIVRAWAERHPGASLPDLLKEGDARRILRDSRYKPET